ncbi:MAG TPA: NADH-quinone oxidoreductase subunit M [Alphaproteobacteria bacterium]|nr:NADH-quinone oxidoreductase subunit M [Alphaproteobacteria bacterium]
MTAAWLIAVLLGGGILAWLAGGARAVAARLVSLATLALGLAMALALWTAAGQAKDGGPWISEVRAAWIPELGISLHLAVDGLSLLLIVLTLLVGLLAVACSWREIDRRVGFFHFNLLWTLAGVVGVFAALDLFLFFFFWEVMLVPMYFIVALWGHEARVRAAIKFFIFTQGSGLLMLAAILGLVFAHQVATGSLSFDYPALLGTPLAPATAMWLMLGFFVAFAVKLPVVPLHTWLPDAHTQAPTGGSVILAGILLKTGAYGLIRFAVPLFPGAAASFAPYAMALGALGILYGAVLAFAQDDFKRLVAYTSVSHLGFVLLGVYAWNALALQGAVMQMLAHGLSTGALFVIAGMLQERLHSRDMRRMGGLWAAAPRMAATALFFAIASLGLPGFANFIGEFMALAGAFRAEAAITAVAVPGLIAATVYALVLVQRSFHGAAWRGGPFADLSPREGAEMAATGALLLALGIYPALATDAASRALDALLAAPVTAMVN